LYPPLPKRANFKEEEQEQEQEQETGKKKQE